MGLGKPWKERQGIESEDVFYNSLYRLGCCHGDFFQNTKLGLSPLFHTGEEIKGGGGLRPEATYECRTFLASILIYLLLWRAHQLGIPAFLTNALGSGNAGQGG